MERYSVCTLYSGAIPPAIAPPRACQARVCWCHRTCCTGAERRGGTQGSAASSAPPAEWPIDALLDALFEADHVCSQGRLPPLAVARGTDRARMALCTSRALLTRCMDTRIASLDYSSVTSRLILGYSMV